MEKDAAPPSYPIAQVVTTTQQAAASTTQVPQATVVGVTGVSAAPTFTAVIVNTTPSGATGYYDRTPRRIICQFCGYEVITGTRPTTGLGTHLIAFGTCCVGCVSSPKFTLTLAWD